MPKPSSGAAFQEPPSTVRQLKLLVLVLVVSNVGLGFLSVYLLRAVDERYTDLFDHSIPVLHDLRELTSAVIAAQRAAGSSVLFRATPAELPARLAQAEAALASARKLSEQALASETLLKFPECQAMRSAAEQHQRNLAEMLKLMRAGAESEAVRLREAAVLPAFDRYLASIGEVGAAIEKTSMSESDRVTERIGTMSKLVLGVASWPVIVLVALVLVTVIFVLVLMFMFRGRETSDMP
jgi:hypothetical protein